MAWLQGPHFDHEFRSCVCVEFCASSPHRYVGFLQVLWFCDTSQKHTRRWIIFAKLRLTTNECVNVCVFGPL